MSNTPIHGNIANNIYNVSVGTGASSINNGGITNVGSGGVYGISTSWSGSGNVVTSYKYVRIEQDGDRAVIDVRGSNAIIRTDDGDIDLKQLASMCKEMAGILCRIQADFEKNEDFPALKEAYEHYQIVEKLTRDPDSEL